MALFSVDVFHHIVRPDPPGGPDEFALLRADIATLKETLMATMVELEATLNTVADQLDKAKAEITAGLQDLRDALAAGAITTPGVDAAVARLTGGSQALDDIFVDAPPPPPPEEPAP